MMINKLRTGSDACAHTRKEAMLITMQLGAGDKAVESWGVSLNQQFLEEENE